MAFTHEEIICIRTETAHFEKLYQIKELSVYVAAYLSIG